jgi:hypothetical protein
MKNRQVTFNKRKIGLIKKAVELSVLCDCEVAMVILHGDKLYQYSSASMSEILQQYFDYEGNFEIVDNSDVGFPKRVLIDVYFV